MSETFNIYCDESCHLERDGSSHMAIGAVWCKADEIRAISKRILQIKDRHGMLRPPAPEGKFRRRDVEAKWSIITNIKLKFYQDLIDFFFDEDDLHFRAIVIKKSVLAHEQFDQTHDDWYYKMLFMLLEPLIDPRHLYRVYLDIKDTRSEAKRKRLEDVLRTCRGDHACKIIQRVQQIRSHESQILQITDILLGAVTYFNRMAGGDFAGGVQSAAKLAIVNMIKKRSKKNLATNTWLRESKFNLLHWEGRGAQ